MEDKSLTSNHLVETLKIIEKKLNTFKINAKKINDIMTKIHNSNYLPSDCNFCIDDLTKFFNETFLKNNINILSLSMIKGLINNKLNDNKNYTTTVIYCDINGLKMANDTFGHSEADKGFEEIANIINNVIRTEPNQKIEDEKRKESQIETDTVILIRDENKNIAIRPHGDEFIIILPNCTKESAEKIVIQRIKEKINDSLENTKGMTLAMGIADTNELDIPKQMDEINLSTFFNNIINIAEEKMRKEKEKTLKEKTVDQKLYDVEKDLGRTANKLGLDLYDPKDFKNLINFCLLVGKKIHGPHYNQPKSK